MSRRSLYLRNFGIAHGPQQLELPLDVPVDSWKMPLMGKRAAQRLRRDMWFVVVVPDRKNAHFGKHRSTDRKILNSFRTNKSH